MENFWNTLKQFLERNVVKLLCSVVTLLEKAIDFLSDVRKDKLKNEAEKKVQEAEKKIDEACDSGDLDDLFDAAEQLRRAKKAEKEVK